MAGPLLAFVAAHGPAELSALLLAAQAGLPAGGGAGEPGRVAARRRRSRRRGREAARLLAVSSPVLRSWRSWRRPSRRRRRFPPWAKAALGLGLAAALWTFLARGGRRAASAA